MSRYPHKTGPSQGPFQGIVQTPDNYPLRQLTYSDIHVVSPHYTETEIKEAINVLKVTYGITDEELLLWLSQRTPL